MKNMWKRLFIIEEYIRLNKEENQRIINSNKLRIINQYSKDWSYINTFKNLKDASLKTWIRRSYIREACNWWKIIRWWYQWEYYNWNINDIEPIKYFNKETSLMVNKYKLDWKFIETFNSLHLAWNSLWKWKRWIAWISSCIHFKTKKAYWYQWRLFNWNTEDISPIEDFDNKIQVEKYDLRNNFIECYKSISECSKKTWLSYSSIYRCLKWKQNTSWWYIFKNKYI